MSSIQQKDLRDKREKEKRIVKTMIEIYCQGHQHLASPCQECSQLMDYVNKRIDRCPFMETKTYCSNCEVHCYREDMRKKIREVMRYSGPRMIFHHPLMLVDHAYQGGKYWLKTKKKAKKNTKEGDS